MVIPVAVAVRVISVRWIAVGIIPVRIVPAERIKERSTETSEEEEVIIIEITVTKPMVIPVKVSRVSEVSVAEARVGAGKTRPRSGG